LQAKELVDYESKWSNFAVAVETQKYFNSLLYVDEVDSRLAKMVGNAHDGPAAHSIQSFNRSVLEEENRRRMENDKIVSELKDVSMDSLVIGALESKECDVASLSTTCESTESLCVVCHDRMDGNKLRISLPTACKHTYCDNCFKEWLVSASQDNSLLPFRCCRQSLPPEFVTFWVKRLLNGKHASMLLSSMEEVYCVNKMYCPVETCSAFIDLDKVANTLDITLNFQCIKCAVSICFDCKSLKHELTLSCEENQLKIKTSFDETSLRALGYQKCTKCNRFVELSFGCNHMTCLCRHEFCYECGSRWKTCTCVVTDADRLFAQQELLVPQNIVGQRRVEVVAARARQAQIDIEAEENCNHRRVTKTFEFEERRNKPKCRLCALRLNIFGYICNGCNIKLCINCHLHR